MSYFNNLDTKAFITVYTVADMRYQQKVLENEERSQLSTPSGLRNTNEISEICHKQQQPVFITKNGYGDLVVMSMETYDELLSTNHIDKAKAGFSDPKSAIYNS